MVASATLAMARDFSRFIAKAGLPETCLTNVMPSPFHFQEQAVLAVPACAVDPRATDLHTASLIDNIPALLEADIGSLVLFSSWRQLFEVYDGLDEQFQHRVAPTGSLGTENGILAITT